MRLSIKEVEDSLDRGRGRLVVLLLTVLAPICATSPVLGHEPEVQSTSKPRHTSRPVNRFAVSPIEDECLQASALSNGLSSWDKERLEELWKALQFSDAIKRLQVESNIGLFDFEEIYWRVFDRVILDKIPQAGNLGVSLTIPELEPDYPRYGNEFEPFGFGVVRPRGRTRAFSEFRQVDESVSRSAAQKIIFVLADLVDAYKSYTTTFQHDSKKRTESRGLLLELLGENVVKKLDESLRAR